MTAPEGSTWTVMPGKCKSCAAPFAECEIKQCCDGCVHEVEAWREAGWSPWR